jgi:hypothetical protein
MKLTFFGSAVSTARVLPRTVLISEPNPLVTLPTNREFANFLCGGELFKPFRVN